MGFRSGALLFAVSFLLGVQFMNFNIDYRLLFVELNNETFEDAFTYYATFYNAPIGVRALLHAVMGVGLISIFAKLHKWDESAVFFDGSSLFLYCAALVIYIAVSIGGLQTSVAPLAHETLDLRQEAMRVFAAANVLIVGCLLGVLLMQAGQEYVRRQSEKAIQEYDAAQNAKAAQEKKEQ
ncbi:Shr3 amino acid permease chaperone [Auriculariales sp. MPI-PUGE-AT-0066]|nr:Shr3 amino acid permease chaperone [Auriculariales sp. MPI-PUGE-AT-0066]